MKRVFAVLLCSFLMLSLFSLSASASATEAEAETSLRFGDDDTFTIVQLTDFHVQVAMAEGEKQFFQDIVESIGPDIINTQNCTFSGYESFIMGFRVFELNEDNPWEYETYTKTWLDFYEDDSRMLLVFYASNEDVFFPVKLVAWSILNPVRSIPHWLSAIAITAGLVVLIRSIIKKNTCKRVSP